MMLAERARSITAWMGDAAWFYDGTAEVRDPFSVVVNDTERTREELAVMLEGLLVMRTALTPEVVRKVVEDFRRVITADLTQGGAPPVTELHVELYTIGPTEIAIGINHVNPLDAAECEAEDGTVTHLGHDETGCYCLMHYVDGVAA